MNAAICLTLLRLAFTPIMVYFFYATWPWGHFVAASLFAAASVTDWLDGFIARKYAIVTPFGAFLDPIADKIIVMVALVLVVSEHPGVVFVLPALLILAREILISALRQWLAALGNPIALPVTWLAKLKTAFQMLALCLLLLEIPNMPYQQLCTMLGLCMLYVAALLSVISIIFYIKMSWLDLTRAVQKP